MSKLNVTSRTRIRQLPKRAVYERSDIYAILDEAPICHIGFVQDDQPYVIPTIHTRLDDALYIHGSTASRMLRALSKGGPACVTVTLLDGLVLARSAFHHSMNYRSVIILGTFTPVENREQKLAALEAIVEHVMPGRSAETRGANDKELNATAVLSMRISEASAKVRTGPPGDDEEDYALPIWAGVVPLSLQPGTPQPDPLLGEGVEIPASVKAYRKG